MAILAMAMIVLTMMRFVMQERAEAVSDWLEGDEAAMVAAERKAAKLVGAWLTWLRCQSVEALPAVRMDMRINPHPGPDPGPNPHPNPHPNPNPNPEPSPHPHLSPSP